MNDLIGEGLIIKVSIINKSIRKSFVTQQNILQNDFVFFKTNNSNLSKQGMFHEKYVYIEPEAAEALLDKKV